MKNVFRRWGEGKASCRECVDRTVGCHSSCERYRAYKAQNDAERETRLRELRMNDKIADIHRAGGRRKT